MGLRWRCLRRIRERKGREGKGRKELYSIEEITDNGRDRTELTWAFEGIIDGGPLVGTNVSRTTGVLSLFGFEGVR